MKHTDGLPPISITLEPPPKPQSGIRVELGWPGRIAFALGFSSFVVWLAVSDEPPDYHTTVQAQAVAGQVVDVGQALDLTAAAVGLLLALVLCCVVGFIAGQIVGAIVTRRGMGRE